MKNKTKKQLSEVVDKNYKFYEVPVGKFKKSDFKKSALNK